MGLAACGAAPASEPESALDVETSTGENVTLFAEILAQHQALNERVERISHTLMTANAPLCDRVHRSAGLSVHTQDDYPNQLRPIAREYLGVGEGLSVRAVVKDGPADRAGVRAGDAIRNVGGMPVANLKVARKIWGIAEGRELQAETVSLRVIRDGEPVVMKMETDAACDYPVTVIFSETPNAYTDGEELVITSELVRRTQSDSRLALILAHELAHALVHDVEAGEDYVRGPEVELDADAKGLVLVARAGFDLETAIAEMDAFGRDFAVIDSSTHPGHDRRVDAMRETAAELNAKMDRGETLSLN